MLRDPFGLIIGGGERVFATVILAESGFASFSARTSNQDKNNKVKNALLFPQCVCLMKGNVLCDWRLATMTYVLLQQSHNGNMIDCRFRTCALISKPEYPI